MTLQGGNRIAVSQANRYVTANDILRDERTNSVWGNILLHMLVNFISLKALLLLEQLL